MKAKRKFDSVMRKLETKQMYFKYDKVFEKWLSLDIIEKVPCNKFHKICHFLQYHSVLKEKSMMTKVGPVFCASCMRSWSCSQKKWVFYLKKIRSWSQKETSVNQCLVKGPNIELIPDWLFRFQDKPMEGTADIKKAFLQIEIAAGGRKLLRFLW